MRPPEQTIVKILTDLRPVRPMPGPARLTAYTLLILAAACAAAVYVFGFEGLSAMNRMDLIFLCGSLAVALGVLAYGFAQSMVPGSLRKLPVLLIQIVLGGVFLVSAALLFHKTYPFDLWPIHRECFTRGTGVAAGLCLLGFFVSRLGFWANRERGLLMLFSMAGAGALFVLTVSCPIQNMTHVLMGHISAVLVVILLGVIAGRLARYVP